MLPYPHIDPVAVPLGTWTLPYLGKVTLAVRWYALAYLTGVLSGWWLVGKLNKRRTPPTLSAVAFDDIMVWAILGIILGGRLGYVLFYKPGFYLDNPGEILKVWQGGMSFHGGLLGTIIAMLIFTRNFRIRFLDVTDLLAVAAPIGLCLGRLANFINGELYGRETTSALGMVFPTDLQHLVRYPSQLFEAGLEGVALFCIMLFAAFRTRALEYTGALSGLFLIGYSLARMSVECFREPDNFLPAMPLGITMGQILSTPMLAVGIWLLVRAREKHAGHT